MPNEGEATPTSHTYYSQRLRLHYLDWGNPDAPPLLLIHGNRDHCHNWDWVARRLRHRFHIIAPDLRGHGDSQWSTGSTYSRAEFVYDIAHLVHQADLAPLAIVAHSLGSNVALMYASVHPDSVTRLVAVEGFGRPPVPPELVPSPEQRMQAWIENGRSLAGRRPRRYQSLDDAFQRMQEANRHLSPEQARYLTIHGANQNEDGTYSWKFDNYVHIGTPHDLPESEVRTLWGNIACPVLLISGAESWSLVPDDVGNIVAAFQNARHEIVPDAGHWPHHDRLDLFVELVSDFLG